jgi:hypothetical protein
MTVKERTSRVSAVDPIWIGSGRGKLYLPFSSKTDRSLRRTSSSSSDNRQVIVYHSFGTNVNGLPEPISPRFVDQGRRLESLAGLLLGEFLGCQAAQLVVDQRQQLRGGVRVALFDGGQDAGHVSHRQHPTARSSRRDDVDNSRSGSGNR